MSLIALEEAPNGVLQDAQGNALVGHVVHVYLRGTNTHAQVFSDATGVTVLSQPLASSSNGSIPGYVAAEVPLDFLDVTSGRLMPSDPISAADVAPGVVNALQKAANLSDVQDADSSRANVKVPVLTPVTCVATTNQALAGLPVIDNYQVVAGDLVLLAAQSTASQNGPWVAASGSWSRPNEFSHGRIVTAREVSVVGGSVYGKSRWLLQTTGSKVVDTDSLTWVQFPGAGAGGSGFPTGVWMASDWGAKWRAARAAASSRQVVVVGWGASIMEGFYSSSNATNAFFGKLISALQARYGDGGSGWVSTHQLAGTVAGSAGSITSTGAWSGWPLGLNTYGVFPSSPSSGAILTFSNVRGTTIKILWYPSFSPSFTNTSHFTYSIDGGAAVDVNSTGAAADQLYTTTISGLAAGNHTVVITATSGSPIIEAVGGFNATGIVGHNFGKAGRGSGDVGTASSLSSPVYFTTGLASIYAQAPDLLILSDDLAINDMNASVSVAGHEANLATACDLARLGNQNCDIVIVGHHRGSGSDGNELYPQYQKVARVIAETYGALWVNMWPAYRNSYANAQSVSYWGTTGSNSGSPGSDPVHPGDIGHGLIEAPLETYLTA